MTFLRAVIAAVHNCLKKGLRPDAGSVLSTPRTRLRWIARSGGKIAPRPSLRHGSDNAYNPDRPGLVEQRPRGNRNRPHAGRIPQERGAARGAYGGTG